MFTVYKDIHDFHVISHEKKVNRVVRCAIAIWVVFIHYYYSDIGVYYVLEAGAFIIHVYDEDIGGSRSFTFVLYC